jgi:copper chaperone CopZ
MITTLAIRGMTSVHAVRAVFTAFGSVDGVIRAEVALGQAVVHHLPTVTTVVLMNAVALAGYEVEAAHADTRSLPVMG